MFFRYGILINEVILMATIDERIEKLEEKKRAVEPTGQTIKSS